MAQVKTKHKLFLKYVLWVLAIVIASYILLVAFIVSGPQLKSYIEQTPFDSTEWKKSTHRSDNVKQKMVHDLLKNHKLEGMSVEDIDKLLGKPPVTDYFKDYDYVYWLGPERGMGVDSEWLGIKFQEGKVIRADILRD